jgi:hypothetical protein
MTEANPTGRPPNRAPNLAPNLAPLGRIGHLSQPVH